MMKTKRCGLLIVAAMLCMTSLGLASDVGYFEPYNVGSEVIVGQNVPEDVIGTIEGLYARLLTSDDSMLDVRIKRDIINRLKAANGIELVTVDDLLSETYNPALAVLGALAISDVYRNNGGVFIKDSKSSEKVFDNETLEKAGFVRADKHSRVEFGRVEDFGKTLEVITLEKKVGDKRFIAIVFEGTHPSQDFFADWTMNGFNLGGIVKFPFWRGQDKMTAAQAEQLLLREKYLLKDKMIGMRAAIRCLNPLLYRLFDQTVLKPSADVGVHVGFRTMAWDYMMMEGKISFKSDGKTLFDLIEEAKSNENIRFLVFGHSMGGALATLYSAELAERGLKKKPTCYTYAAAACGDRKLTEQFANKVNYHGFYHPKDVIQAVGWVPWLHKAMEPEYLFSDLGAHYNPGGKFSWDGFSKGTKYHSHVLYAINAMLDYYAQRGQSVDKGFKQLKATFLMELGLVATYGVTGSY